MIVYKRLYVYIVIFKESILANTEQAIPAVERKPLACLMADMAPEKKHIAEYLYKDILRVSGVSWADIKGLEDAKTILMECVVYPLKYVGGYSRSVLRSSDPRTEDTSHLARFNK